MSRTERRINSTSAAILGLLHAEPLTGHDIVAIAGKWMRPFWNMTRSQVYRELPEMAVRGYVKMGKVGSRNAQPYKITAKGKKAFQQWLLGDPDPDLLRSEAALRVAFGHLQEAEQVEQLMTELVDRHSDKLRQIEMLMGEAEASDLPYDLEALRFAASYHRMCINWLSSVEMPD